MCVTQTELSGVEGWRFSQSSTVPKCRLSSCLLKRTYESKLSDYQAEPDFILIIYLQINWGHLIISNVYNILELNKYDKTKVWPLAVSPIKSNKAKWMC